jgi:hypothetical protein
MSPVHNLAYARFPAVLEWALTRFLNIGAGGKMGKFHTFIHWKKIEGVQMMERFGLGYAVGRREKGTTIPAASLLVYSGLSGWGINLG